MKIGSVSENQKIEKRISITPEIAKKYISIGLEVHLSKNYGVHLGISDEEFINLGVKFSDDENEVINRSNIIVQLGLNIPKPDILQTKFSFSAKDCIFLIQ